MPQQPSSADLAKQFGGTDVSALAAQFGGSAVSDVTAGLSIPSGTAPKDAIAQMHAYNQAQGLEGQETPTWLSSALSFGKGVAEQLNPLEIVKGIYGALTSPIETTKGLAKAQIDQFSKGKTAYDEG